MTEPVWITKLEVLAIHDCQLAEHGGAAGVRDTGLLESAIARPQQLYAHGDPDIFDLAAACTVGIVRNHPFIDGNKRAGFVIGVLFVELNGRRFTASEPDATQSVLALAAGEMSEGEFAAWLRDNTQ
ncbi:MAG: type II toxin-antitoxin system death-on-curing family toxin [Chloroflexi bacterium]|nr:MAG: type II toxin-antitoxin system death-on-curing family toxin [Chloroflexota bacterium]